MFALPDFKEEKRLWKRGYRLVIGVDEVGRGAFAGPVVAAAVAFLPLNSRSVKSAEVGNENFLGPQLSRDETQTLHNRLGARQNATSENSVASPRLVEIIERLGINDSKKLRPLQRKKLAEEIKKCCLAWGIGKVGVRTINRVGIGKATQQAMRCSIRKLLNCYIVKIVKSNNNSAIQQSNNCFVLVDAFHIKYLRGVGLKNQKAIKGGDRKSISIAAASILAKVYRDNLMRKFTKRYREYHFGRNKGYGTRKHQRAIIKKGITPLHRKRFVDTFLAHHATIAK